jgi:hypothetical protein
MIGLGSEVTLFALKVVLKVVVVPDRQDLPVIGMEVEENIGVLLGRAVQRREQTEQEASRNIWPSLMGFVGKRVIAREPLHVPDELVACVHVEPFTQITYRHALSL